MAKETNNKKSIANKKTATKKKVTKVTEEQLPKIAEEIGNPTTVNEDIDLEKFKDESGEYDLTKASEIEVKSAINQLDGEDVIIVKKTEEIKVNEEAMEELKKVSEPKVDFVEQDPPLEVKNGDPSVIAPIEKETVKDAPKSVKENKSRKLNVDPFTYAWNGQEIDY